jgi:peptidoglycan/LPS O-acetylase OafA/YrhL
VSTDSHRTPDKRLQTVDAIRGVASLAVCWFHLTNGHVGFLQEGFLKASGSAGWAGVESFFVISGFIIPYALFRSGYRPRDYGRFILRRLIRLEPPYLIAILLVLFLGWLSSMAPAYRGAPFAVDPLQLAFHLGYLNAFVGREWLNPVFWTLAIEFQYYLVIGLGFVLLVRRDGSIILLTAIALATFLPFPATFLTAYGSIFAMGISTATVKMNKQKYFVQHVVVLVMTTVITLLKLGWLVALVAVATALAIWLISYTNVLLTFLGEISYSLYLLHVPVGGRIINFASHYQLTAGERVIAVFAALAISLVAAYVFWRLVERPAQRWAASVSYRREATTESDRRALEAEW